MNSLFELIPALAKFVASQNRYIDPKEIEVARRTLPLPGLMRVLGDERHISQVLIDSPFHAPGTAAFRIRSEGQSRKRWFYFCCHTCGKRGDEIDYLRIRFSLAREVAEAVFVLIAKIILP